MNLASSATHDIRKQLEQKYTVYLMRSCDVPLLKVSHTADTQY